MIQELLVQDINIHIILGITNQQFQIVIYFLLMWWVCKLCEDLKTKKIKNQNISLCTSICTKNGKYLRFYRNKKNGMLY